MISIATTVRGLVPSLVKNGDDPKDPLVEGEAPSPGREGTLPLEGTSGPDMARAEVEDCEEVDMAPELSVMVGIEPE